MSRTKLLARIKALERRLAATNVADSLAHLDAHALRQVAVEAMVDPRTVARLLAGGEVRPLSAQRIRAALSRLGFEVPQ